MSLQDKIEDGFPTQDEIDERLNRDPRFAQEITQMQGNIADCFTGKNNHTSGTDKQPNNEK